MYTGRQYGGDVRVYIAGLRLTRPHLVSAEYRPYRLYCLAVASENERANTSTDIDAEIIRAR